MTEMTTQQWLAKILSSKDKLHNWLIRQYIGEMTAVGRIARLASTAPEKNQPILWKIADDEFQHATWVLNLLIARGISCPDIENAQAEDRYWKPVKEGMNTFEDTAAAGHYAESMRLVRIRAIVNCTEIDKDIRDVFIKILPDEEMHEKAFKAMTNQASLDKMKSKHEAGLKLLGLEI